MDKEQRAALRKLAEEATPGPWQLVGTIEQVGGDYADIIPTKVDCMAHCYGGSPERGKQEDLEYIAAANPSTILQLLDYIETLEKDAAHKLASAEPFVWYEGYPPFPQDQEWFIAVTKYGDKVVLRALPEEYNYDYKTADETYMKKELVVQWAQFPDCEYLPPQCKEKRNEH